jgi:hypothetical protein
MKQILLVDETGRLPPALWQGHLQGCVGQIRRSLQRTGVIERAQLAPSNLLEQPEVSTQRLTYVRSASRVILKRIIAGAAFALG